MREGDVGALDRASLSAPEGGPDWRRALVAVASAPFAAVLVAGLVPVARWLAAPTGPGIGERTSSLSVFALSAVEVVVSASVGFVCVVGLLAACGRVPSWLAAAAAACTLPSGAAGLFLVDFYGRAAHAGGLVTADLVLPAFLWPALMAAAGLAARTGPPGRPSRRVCAVYALAFAAALLLFLGLQPWTGALWPFTLGKDLYDATIGQGAFRIGCLAASAVVAAVAAAGAVAVGRGAR